MLDSGSNFCKLYVSNTSVVLELAATFASNLRSKYPYRLIFYKICIFPILFNQSQFSTLCKTQSHMSLALHVPTDEVDLQGFRHRCIQVMGQSLSRPMAVSWMVNVGHGGRSPGWEGVDRGQWAVSTHRWGRPGLSSRKLQPAGLQMQGATAASL